MVFVSPIFPFITAMNSENPWHYYVHELFRVVQSVGKWDLPLAVDRIPTNIMFSGPRIWTSNSLQKLCRSIIWFEEAFEVLLPPPMRQNPYYASNSVDNPEFQCLDVAVSLQKIGACKNVEDLRQLVCAPRPEQKEVGQLTRYAWNLQAFANEWSGTVAEYGRAPPVANAKDCIMWVETIMSFVHAGTQCWTRDNVTNHAPTVQGLKQFINQAYNSEHLDRMFEGNFGTRQVMMSKPLIQGASWQIQLEACKKHDEEHSDSESDIPLDIPVSKKTSGKFSAVSCRYKLFDRVRKVWK